MKIDSHSELEFKQSYRKIRKQYKGKLDYHDVELQMNNTNNFLEDYFQKNKIELGIIYKYLVYRYFMSFPKTFINNISFFIKFINISKTIYNRLIQDDNIQIYDKIRILTKSFIHLKSCKDEKSLEKINIRYFLISQCQKNSIIEKVEMFYKQLISGLTEDSVIFQYLLKIDSGTGYYHNELLYTFDLSNLEMIKWHLNELFPSVLLFFYSENSNIGSTNKQIGCISINEFNLLKNITKDQIIYDKFSTEQNEEISDEIAMNIVIILFHEYMGHRKFSFSNPGDSSPKRIVNKSSKIIELKYLYDKIENEDDEYILTTKNKNKGDSGHYLELAYGKYNGKLITNLMLKLNNKAKLLKRPDLFNDSSWEILRNYIIFKTVLNDENLIFNKNYSIEEEINFMKNNVKEDNLNITEKEDLNNFILGKKTKGINIKIEEEKNDNSDEDNSSDDIHKNNKRKKVDHFNLENINVDSNEIKEKEIEGNKIEESEENSSSIINDKDDLEEENEELSFEKLYQKIIRKYGFEEDELLRENIREKLKEQNLTFEEKNELFLLFEYLSEVE